MVKEIREKLAKLKELGYIKVAFIIESKKPLVLDILIIHGDWKDYSFTLQYEQAIKDIDNCLGGPGFHSLEIPTLEMYKNERHSEAPDHDHVVFDLTSKNS